MTFCCTCLGKCSKICSQENQFCVNSGCRRLVNEILSHMGCHALWIGSWLPTSHLRGQACPRRFWTALPLNVGPIDFPKTWATTRKVWALWLNSSSKLSTVLDLAPSIFLSVVFFWWYTLNLYLKLQCSYSEKSRIWKMNYTDIHYASGAKWKRIEQNIKLHCVCWGLDCLDSIALRLDHELDDRRISVRDSFRAGDFSLLHSSSDLGPTQPPILWTLELTSPGVKRSGREAGHSPSCRGC
jgi:hypothetical protein